MTILSFLCYFALGILAGESRDPVVVALCRVVTSSRFAVALVLILACLIFTGCGAAPAPAGTTRASAVAAQGTAAAAAVEADEAARIAASKAASTAALASEAQALRTRADGEASRAAALEDAGNLTAAKEAYARAADLTRLAVAAEDEETRARAEAAAAEAVAIAAAKRSHTKRAEAEAATRAAEAQAAKDAQAAEDRAFRWWCRWIGAGGAAVAVAVGVLLASQGAPRLGRAVGWSGGLAALVLLLVGEAVPWLGWVALAVAVVGVVALGLALWRSHRAGRWAAAEWIETAATLRDLAPDAAETVDLMSVRRQRMRGVVRDVDALLNRPAWGLPSGQSRDLTEVMRGRCDAIFDGPTEVRADPTRTALAAVAGEPEHAPHLDEWSRASDMTATDPATAGKLP